MNLIAATREQGGFTLVETVVAFAILSLVLAAAIQVVGGGSGRARMEQQRAAALADAQSHLALLSVSASLAQEPTEGVYPGGSTWRLSISPVDDGAAIGHLTTPYLVELEVAPRRGARIRLNSIVLGRSD